MITTVPTNARSHHNNNSTTTGQKVYNDTINKMRQALSAALAEVTPLKLRSLQYEIVPTEPLSILLDIFKVLLLPADQQHLELTCAEVFRESFNLKEKLFAVTPDKITFEQSRKLKSLAIEIKPFLTGRNSQSLRQPPAVAALLKWYKEFDKLYKYYEDRKHKAFTHPNTAFGGSNNSNDSTLRKTSNNARNTQTATTKTKTSRKPKLAIQTDASGNKYGDEADRGNEADKVTEEVVSDEAEEGSEELERLKEHFQAQIKVLEQKYKVKKDGAASKDAKAITKPTPPTTTKTTSNNTIPQQTKSMNIYKQDTMEAPSALPQQQSPRQHFHNHLQRQPQQLSPALSPLPEPIMTTKDAYLDHSSGSSTTGSDNYNNNNESMLAAIASPIIAPLESAPSASSPSFMMTNMESSRTRSFNNNNNNSSSNPNIANIGGANNIVVGPSPMMAYSVVYSDDEDIEEHEDDETEDEGYGDSIGAGYGYDYRVRHELQAEPAEDTITSASNLHEQQQQQQQQQQRGGDADIISNDIKGPTFKSNKVSSPKSIQKLFADDDTDGGGGDYEESDRPDSSDDDNDNASSSIESSSEEDDDDDDDIFHTPHNKTNSRVNNYHHQPQVHRPPQPNQQQQQHPLESEYTSQQQQHKPSPTETHMSSHSPVASAASLPPPPPLPSPAYDLTGIINNDMNKSDATTAALMNILYSSTVHFNEIERLKRENQRLRLQNKFIRGRVAVLEEHIANILGILDGLERQAEEADELNHQQQQQQHLLYASSSSSSSSPSSASSSSYGALRAHHIVADNSAAAPPPKSAAATTTTTTTSLSTLSGPLGAPPSSSGSGSTATTSYSERYRDEILRWYRTTVGFTDSSSVSSSPTASASASASATFNNQRATGASSPLARSL